MYIEKTFAIKLQRSLREGRELPSQDILLVLQRVDVLRQFEQEKEEEEGETKKEDEDEAAGQGEGGRWRGVETMINRGGGSEGRFGVMTKEERSKQGAKEEKEEGNMERMGEGASGKAPARGLGFV